MILTHDHLSDANLVALWHGQHSSAEQEAAENHLLKCDECSRRAASIAPPDEFVELLFRAKAGSDDSFLKPKPIRRGQTHSDNTHLSGVDSTICGVIHPRIPEELIGHSRYRVIELLGSGGMGNVWLAEHLVMHRQVALKLIHPELLTVPGAIERFQREVIATAKLNHPNLAPAYDAEKIGNVFFLVMEYVPGRTLMTLLSNGPMSLRDACRAVRDAALGLSYAHSMGLIHRDIKPGNLLRTESGDVKVVDFGLVAAIGQDSSLTTDNLVMGTPDYISPEQAINPRSADIRSDIYSLGCTLYHLLSGHALFPEMSMVKKIDCHRFRDPEPLFGLPEGLWNILSQMIRKDPQQRFLAASEVAIALEPFCGNERFDAHNVVKTTPLDGRRTDQYGSGVKVFLVLSLAVAGIAFAWNAFANKKLTAESATGPVTQESLGHKTNGGLVQSNLPAIPLECQFSQKRSGLTASLEFSSDGRTLYSAGADGFVLGWDLDSRKSICRIGLGTPARWLARTNDGKDLLVATDNGLRRIKLDEDYAISGFTTIPIGSMAGVAVSPDGRRAVTCSLERGTIRIWSLENDSLELTWSAAHPTENRPYVYGVAWSPDGNYVVTAGDAGLTIWNASTGSLASQLTEQREHSLFFSENGRELFVAGFHDGIHVFDCQESSRAKTISGISWARICRTATGRMLTLSDNNVSLWNASSERKTARFVGCDNKFAAIASSPDGRRVACNDIHGNTYIWRLPNELSFTGSPNPASNYSPMK